MPADRQTTGPVLELVLVLYHRWFFSPMSDSSFLDQVVVDMLSRNFFDFFDFFLRRESIIQNSECKDAIPTCIEKSFDSSGCGSSLSRPTTAGGPCFIFSLSLKSLTITGPQRPPRLRPELVLEYLLKSLMKDSDTPLSHLQLQLDEIDCCGM